MKLKAILFLSVVIRIIFSLLFYDEFNFWQYLTFSGFALQGFNPWSVGYTLFVYRMQHIWPDPPPFLIPMIMAQVSISYFQNEIALLVLTRIPNIIADAVSTYFFYKIALSMSEKNAPKLTLLFSVNPLFIFSTLVSNDSFPIACTIIALYFFLQKKESDNDQWTRVAISAFFLGLGTAFKQYPAILSIVFLAKLRKMKEFVTFFLFLVFPLFIFSLPFLVWDAPTYLEAVTRFYAGSALPVSFFGVKDAGALYFQTRPRYSTWSMITILLYGSIFAPPDSIWVLNQLATISLLLSLVLLFVYVRRANVSIVAGVIVTFLLVYALLFVGKAHYFAYYLPFAYLYPIKNRQKETMSVSKGLLYFYWIPSFFYTLLFPGQFGNYGGRFYMGGSSGIFWYTYHWLGVSKLAFLYIPWPDLTVDAFIPMINFFMTLYFLLEILGLTTHFKTKIKTGRESAKAFFRSTAKRRNRIAAFFVFTLAIALFISSGIGNATEPAHNFGSDNSFIFFDDFQNHLLSFHWLYYGDSNGYYTLFPNADPSNILLSSVNGGQSAIVYYMANTSGIITLRLKFNNFAKGSEWMILSESEDGFLGVDKGIGGNTIQFFYMDGVSNYPYALAPEEPIAQSWHVFKVEYNSSGRYLFFDDFFKHFINTGNLFSFLSLGNLRRTENLGGTFAIDWVKVEIGGLGSPHMMNVISALIPSFVIVAVVGILLYYKVEIRKTTKSR